MCLINFSILATSFFKSLYLLNWACTPTMSFVYLILRLCTASKFF